MKIYVAHLKKSNFQKELYNPIRESALNDKHTFVLPHEKPGKQLHSKNYLKNECDLIIAEVSNPSTGLGIELGWANIYKVPIICIYKKDSKLAGSLRVVTDTFLEYTDEDDLIEKLSDAVEKYERNKTRKNTNKK